MTHEDIVYDRRVRLIEYAAKIGNVAEACCVFGVSRKTYYEWIGKAERYGLSALLPKQRRRPHQPNEMSSEEIAGILAQAIARPTLGAKALLRHLRARGVDRSASGVAKVLRRHNLGIAKRRVAALASLTATGTGQLTEAAMEGPFGFCMYASAPGQVVSLDAFYVGRLKGVGAVWQLTAVDVATRTAVVQLIVGDKSAAIAASFLDHLAKALRKLGITMTGILSDNGPELPVRPSKPRSQSGAWSITESRPGHRTTTRCASGSTAPSSTSSTGPTSTAAASMTLPCSTSRSRRGCATTTNTAPTTATTWPDAPRCRSRRNSVAASGRLLPDNQQGNTTDAYLSPRPVSRKL